MSEVPVLALNGITRIFRQGTQELQIFKDLDLAVRRGEIVGLVGQSGSGKSSLLHIAGLLEKPNSGTVSVSGPA